MGKALYKFACILKPFIRPFFPTKFVGSKKIEDKKTVVVMNHNSAWDPIVLTAYMKNHIHFMYKAEFRKSWFLRKVFDGFEYIPVARGDSDIGAIKKSLSILENEGILGIFPEGTRNPDRENLKDFHTGAALLALKSKAPVQFFYIWDKFKAFRKNYIFQGELIYLDEYYDKKINKEILTEVTAILKEKMEELKSSADKYLERTGKKRRKLTKKEQKKLEDYLALKRKLNQENNIE